MAFTGTVSGGFGAAYIFNAISRKDSPPRQFDEAAGTSPLAHGSGEYCGKIVSDVHLPAIHDRDRRAEAGVQPLVGPALHDGRLDKSL